MNDLIGDQVNTRDDVFQRFLRGKRNRNATYPKTSECCCWVYAKVVKRELLARVEIYSIYHPTNETQDRNRPTQTWTALNKIALTPAVHEN